MAKYSIGFTIRLSARDGGGYMNFDHHLGDIEEASTSSFMKKIAEIEEAIDNILKEKK